MEGVSTGNTFSLNFCPIAWHTKSTCIYLPTYPVATKCLVTYLHTYMICTYIPLCNYDIYPLTVIGVGSVIWFFKQPTVPVLNQVQNQRTSVSSFWREKVRNQRTISSGYFQKHQRTDRLWRKEPEKNRQLESQCFWKNSKKLRLKGLYQNSDRFFIKKFTRNR